MANPSENVPPTLPLPSSQPPEDEPPATVASPSNPPSPATRQEPAPATDRTEALVGRKPAPPERDATAVLPGSVTDSMGTQALTPSAVKTPRTGDFPGTIVQTSSGPFMAALGAIPQAMVTGYEVLGELGRGGMGVVYKARQVSLNRLVALKMILSGAHAGRQELARFKAEAEAVAQLQHPNIVQVYEVGESDGRPFFSLEFLEGGSLADKLHGDPMPFRTAAQLLVVLGRAIDAAHHAGIVHRDLKPANILLGRKPTPAEIAGGALPMGLPKITDFGLAKNLKEETSNTQSGSVLGTPNYMAPEQAAGKTHEVGPLADVYALGAILYELLTGRPPFKGDGPWDTVKQVLNDDPLPPTRLRRGLPKDLETICLRCLYKEPAKRYPSALALADDLNRWLEGKPIQARPVSDWEKMVKWAKRQPAVAALIALLVLVIGGGLFGMTVLWLRAEGLRATAQTQKEDADKARDEARKHEGIARDLQEQAQRDYERSRREGYASQLNLAQVALQEARFDRAAQLLADMKKHAAGEEDLRSFEWFYLWELSHSKLTLRGHTNLVSGLVFSPDGRWMATSSLDGTVKVWDPVTGNEKLSIAGHKGPIRAVAYSPDGKLLATGGEDGTARLWDTATGAKRGELKGHTGFVTAVVFSADGRLLATASEDRTACVWDMSSLDKGTKAKPLHVLRGHRHGLTSIAFRPDGRQIATGSWDRTARLWNTATGMSEGELKGHDHWIRCVAYSPDGRRLATASWDQTVKLWDPITAEHVRTLGGYETPVQALCFSPDSQRLATLSVDQTAKLWDLSTLEESAQNISPGKPVRGLAFSPDGQLLASVRFDFTGKGLEGGKELTGHRSAVLAVAFQPGSKENLLASAGADGLVKLWEPTARGEFKPLRTLTGHDGPVRAVAWSADGSRLVTGGEDGTVRLWDPGSSRALRTLRGHTGWVTCVAFSPDGRRIASGSEDRSIRVWDLEEKAESSASAGAPLALEGAEDGVQALAWSRDGKRIVTVGGDGILHFWDVQSGVESKPLPGGQGQIRALAFSPDGKTLATAGWDGLVVLRDGVTGTPKQSLKGHTYGVTGVVFSVDGKRLASSSEDRTVKLWDLVSGRELLTLTGHAAGVTGVALSRDGAILASSCWDQKVRVWQGPMRKQRQ